MASVVATGGTSARAQSTTEAEDAADDAQRRANAASGLVDEAVDNREDIERQLADSITRLNELTAELSRVGADIDRIAAQAGYADVELAGIQADIEIQAVDAYMKVVASPSVSVMNSGTVERALVATTVVEDVVADGRSTVSELLVKRDDLEALKEAFLADQEQYQEIQAEVDAEVANYTSLFEQADEQVAMAIREADEADRAYRAALSAVEVARAKEEERERQEHRAEVAPETTTSTTTPPSGTDPPATDTTTQPTTTTTTAPDDGGGGGGGGGPWDHPGSVEQWRSLVSQFFPANRVEEALRIIDCESNGNPSAVNPYSGASGLFQFLPSTWATTAPNAGYAGASALDPEANVATAAWLANRYQELGYSYWHAWSCKRVLG
ncbi:MAG TPA: transglycosylase SLT domain-containing protein [Acidimicrobiia bacterium]|nr:transglycosylase SLT domain-containing protein [Acidimicrobiia bacterium]